MNKKVLICLALFPANCFGGTSAYVGLKIANNTNEPLYMKGFTNAQCLAPSNEKGFILNLPNLTKTGEEIRTATTITIGPHASSPIIFIGNDLAIGGGCTSSTSKFTTTLYTANNQPVALISCAKTLLINSWTCYAAPPAVADDIGKMPASGFEYTSTATTSSGYAITYNLLAGDAEGCPARNHAPSVKCFKVTVDKQK